MDNLELKNLAIEHGLCAKWVEKWKDDWTVDDHIKMLVSIDGMKFLGENEFPSAGLLLRHGGDKLEKSGVYVKRTAPVYAGEYDYKMHFVGSTCELHIPDWYVGIVHVSNSSDVKIFIGDYCDVFITVYNPKSKVHVGSVGNESTYHIKDAIVKTK